MRVLDYFIKGLDMQVRLDLWRLLNDINSITLKHLMDEKHTTYYNMGLNDEQIAVVAERYVKKFEGINEYMMSYGRCPLFYDCRDLKRTGTEFINYTKCRTTEEVEEIMGCTFEEFELPQFHRDEQQ